MTRYVVHTATDCIWHEVCDTTVPWHGRPGEAIVRAMPDMARRVCALLNDATDALVTVDDVGARRYRESAFAHMAVNSGMTKSQIIGALLDHIDRLSDRLAEICSTTPPPMIIHAGPLNLPNGAASLAPGALIPSQRVNLHRIPVGTCGEGDFKSQPDPCGKTVFYDLSAEALTCACCVEGPEPARYDPVALVKILQDLLREAE